MSDSRRDEIAKLEALFAEHPDGRVFTHLAEAYRRAGDKERAREILEEGLKRHEDYASAHVVLGRVLLDEGRREEAAAAFRRVLELDPHNLVALRAVGDLAKEDGRPEEALEHYRALLALDPGNQEIGATIEALESGEEALESGEEVLESGEEVLESGEVSEPGSAPEGRSAESYAPPSGWEASGVEWTSGDDPGASAAGDDAAAADAPVEFEPTSWVPDEADSGFEPDAPDEPAASAEEAAATAGEDASAEEPAATGPLAAAWEAAEGLDRTPDGESAEREEPTLARSEEPEGSAPETADAKDAGEASLAWPEVPEDVEGVPADAGADRLEADGALDGSDTPGEEPVEPASDDAADSGPAEAEAESAFALDDGPRAAEADDRPAAAAGPDWEVPDVVFGPEPDEPETAEAAAEEAEDGHAAAASGESEAVVGAVEEGDADAPDAGDGPVTETIGDLYARQGLPERAAEIYRQVLRDRPDAERLLAKLEEALAAAAGGAPAGPGVAEPRREEHAAPAGDTAGAGAAEPGTADGSVEEVESAWTGGAGALGAEATPYAWEEEVAGAAEAKPAEEAAEPDIAQYLRALLKWRPAGEDLGDAALTGEGGAADGSRDDGDLESFRAWVRGLRP